MLDVIGKFISGMGEAARKIAGFSPDEFRNFLKLIGAGLLIGFVVFGLAEWYWGPLRLDRLERETQLLMELEEVRNDQWVSQDTQVARTYRDLRDRLQQSAEGPWEDLRDLGAPEMNPRTEQVFFGIFPWLLFAVASFLVPGMKIEEQRFAFLTGLLFVIVPFGALFLLVPLGWPGWIRKGVLPFVGAVIVVLLVNRSGLAEDGGT